MESGGRVPQPRVWAGVEAGGEGREGGGELHGIEEGVGGLLGRGGLLVGHGGALHHGHEVGAGVRGTTAAHQWWVVRWWRGGGAGESCVYLAAGAGSLVPVLLAGVTLPPCPCHTTQLSPGWSLPRYTATISAPLSWLSLSLWPGCSVSVSGCCPARGVSLTTALCLNPTFHCAGPPAPAQPGPLTARSRPGARRRGPPPATRAGRGGAGVRPTTQLATAAQLSPTWSQPPPGSPGRYPAMIIQNARTKS